LAGVVFDSVVGAGEVVVCAPVAVVVPVVARAPPEPSAAGAMPVIAPAPSAPVTIVAPRSFEMFIWIEPPRGLLCFLGAPMAVSATELRGEIVEPPAENSVRRS
jgi:hypothetical protein